MIKLENHLEAIAHWDDLKEVGVIWPYLIEWDIFPYLPKFKALTLHTFNSKGSPNQHIYYFKSQTGNAVLNDAIMAHLLIGTLKEVVFEWFMKLPAGSIKTLDDLKKLFLACFSKMIQKFRCHLSLQPSRRKESLLRLLSKDFGAWHSTVPAAWPSPHWSRYVAIICKLPYSLRCEWQSVALERSSFCKENTQKRLSQGSRPKKGKINLDLIDRWSACQSNLPNPKGEIPWRRRLPPLLNSSQLEGSSNQARANRQY